MIDGKILLLEAGLLLVGAIQFILTQFLTYRIKSLLFLIYSITFYISLAYLVMLVRHESPTLLPFKDKNIIGAGISNSLTMLFGTYAADPRRTPTFIQAVISSAGVIFSVIIGKLLLKKKIEYKPMAIGASLSCLVAGASIPIITMNTAINHQIWIVIYALSIFSRAGFNVFLERYLEYNEDSQAKLKIILYSNLYRFPFLLPFIPLELYLGSGNIWSDFLQSLKMLYTQPDTLILFSFFIGFAVIYFLISTKLSGIAANYTMITSIVIAPLASTFFLIVPSLSMGIQPHALVVLCYLFFNTLAVIFWVMGDQRRATRVGFDNDQLYSDHSTVDLMEVKEPIEVSSY